MFGFSDLHQTPLCVEGWDEAFLEIGKLLYETVLTPKNAELLLKAVEQLPCPCPSKICSIYSFQTSKYKTSCNIPHEECPKALLAAMFSFISMLFSKPEIQNH